MRYTVDETTFAINIYADGEDVPFQFQPDYPNGDKFDSVEEASAWAQAAIDARSEEVRFNAPNGKGLPGEVKYIYSAQVLAKASAEKKLAALGLTAEEIAALSK